MSPLATAELAAVAAAIVGAALILADVAARWLTDRRYRQRREEVHESFQRWKERKVRPSPTNQNH